MTRALFALGLVALGRLAGAAEAASPSEATVFIRVVGTVRAEYQRAWKESLEARDVEVATGSGFVVSPDGYLLTNHHVVSGDDLTLERGGQRLRAKVEVKKVEIVFPSDGTRLEGRVEASDPDLDIAVVSVNGADLPFIGLGDSDALEPGQPVQVVGFPFGRALEVGRAVSAETVPQPSVTRGTVAAVRAGDEGDARYIQTDAAVHPGSSGGPMLDEQGYAIGVIRMAVARGSGPAFAVPINRVKDFLESRGLDRVFPSRRLRLGPLQSFDWKGLRLRLPGGVEDSSPLRLRMEWMPPEELTFLVDRLATPLGLPEVESALLSGQALPGFASAAHPSGRTSRLGSRPALVGSARGAAPSSPDDPALEMSYAIVDLGKEKVVARYLGPAAGMAFNRAVLGGSLESIEADPLLTNEIAAPVAAPLERAALPPAAAPPLLVPQRWYTEPAAPLPCRGLPPTDAALSASPEGDFTVSFRAAWWRSPGLGPDEALAACAWPRAAAGPASYALRHTRLGLTYAIEGVFLARGEGLLQLEMEAPSSKWSFVRDLFSAWVTTVTRQEQR